MLCVTHTHTHTRTRTRTRAHAHTHTHTYKHRHTHHTHTPSIHPSIHMLSSFHSVTTEGVVQAKKSCCMGSATIQKRWWLWSNCWWNVCMQKSHTSIWGGWCFCHLWFVKPALFITTKEHPRWLQLRAASVSLPLISQPLPLILVLLFFLLCLCIPLGVSSLDIPWLCLLPSVIQHPTLLRSLITRSFQWCMCLFSPNAWMPSTGVQTRNCLDVRWTGIPFCSLYICWVVRKIKKPWIWNVWPVGTLSDQSTQLLAAIKTKNKEIKLIALSETCWPRYSITKTCSIHTHVLEHTHTGTHDCLLHTYGTQPTQAHKQRSTQLPIMRNEYPQTGKGIENLM